MALASAHIYASRGRLPTDLNQHTGGAQCPLWVTGICKAKRHVRFTPLSGHVQCKSACPLRAKSGHRDDYEPSGSNAAARGKITLISVNSPGCVSTSIEPACCLTMMSWLMERPSPVPSPAGLVVKNGLNIFSFTSGGMPE